MARLTNVHTGAVVQVREGKVLGAEWVPVDAEKKAPAKKAASPSKTQK